VCVVWQNSELSMKVVEIETRYQQVASDRDHLRLEMQGYKQEKIAQQEEYQRHVSPLLLYSALLCSASEGVRLAERGWDCRSMRTGGNVKS
jgi:hypothetical protein